MVPQSLNHTPSLAQIRYKEILSFIANNRVVAVVQFIHKEKPARLGLVEKRKKQPQKVVMADQMNPLPLPQPHNLRHPNIELLKATIKTRQKETQKNPYTSFKHRKTFEKQTLKTKMD